MKDRNSIPLFDRNEKLCLQRDFQKLSINLNPINNGIKLEHNDYNNDEDGFKQSRKSSESQKYNSNKILEEFNSGIVYGTERKESFNSQGSFKREIMNQILEESPDTEKRHRRKSSGLEKETKGIFSDRKKRFSDTIGRSHFSNRNRNIIMINSSSIAGKKVEIVYSKCMVTISAKFFNNLKNDSTLLNNDNLLKCMVSALIPILDSSTSPPSKDILKTAIDAICFPYCQTTLSLLVFNMLVIATRFPLIEHMLLEKVINFAIKLDCDLSPIRSSQNQFPVPTTLSASSVFQASIRSSPGTIFGRSIKSQFPHSVQEHLSIFSQIPLNPNFTSEASYKIETVLLLLTIYTKSRLQIGSNFTSFFRDPHLNPLLHRFLQSLNTSLSERRIKSVSTFSSPSLSNPSLTDKRSLADFLIKLFSTRILRLKQPNLIQFYVFICISLKTPSLNPDPFQDYFKEKFFEKLILNVFNLSVHTPAKLASLNYIQGFMANSRRVTGRFQFIVLKYLLKLMVYYFKKARKSLKNLIAKDLSLCQFAKFSKFKRSKIINAFSHAVFVRIVFFQARLFDRFCKELKPVSYNKLVKGHKSFLLQNRK